MKRDYYEVLGIKKDAGADEIRRAYRKLAMQYHPDKHRGEKAAEEKFKEISEAYEVLSDHNKKSTYDRFGHEGLKGTFGGGGFDWQNFTHFGDFEDIFSSLGDLFGGADVFGTGWGRYRRPGPRRGSDVEYELEINFTEAVLGTEKTVEVSRYDACTACKGSGAKPGTKDTVCPTCKGKGQISSVAGFFSISRACNECGGSGRVIKDPCRKCNGRGKVRVIRKINVKIPAGVDTGVRLRVSREGNAGEKGGPRGELYVGIHVKKHNFFKRHDNDIYCEVKITFTHAVFGTEIDIPTVDGSVKMKVPRGTPSGKIFRLKGKGVPSLFSGIGRGDELVRVAVEVPQRLTVEQKRILKEFAGTMGEKITPEKGFITKVKEVFSTEGGSASGGK